MLPHRATWWTSEWHITEYSYSNTYPYHEGVWRSGGVAPLILKFGTRSDWSTSCPENWKRLPNTHRRGVSVWRRENILPLRNVEPRFFGCPAPSLLAGPPGLSRVGVSVRTHSPEGHTVLREVSDPHDSKHEDYVAWNCRNLSTFRRYMLS
jgi:hypothetical protein